MQLSGRDVRRMRILIIEDDVESWSLIQRAVLEAHPDANAADCSRTRASA